MLKELNAAQLRALLADIAEQFHLLVPLRQADGTRLLGTWGEGELSLSGPPLQRKPTEHFFPQSEVMLLLDSEGGVQPLPQPTRPLALFGLNAADLRGIAFLDRFFLSPPADDLYFRRRDGALLLGLTGLAGCAGEFLPLATGLCELELIATEGAWLALAHVEQARKWLQDYPDAKREQFAELQRRRVAADTERQERLKLASRLLQEGHVPEDFWAEVAERCILCSGCNLVCPTCNCFCVQDRHRDGGTERSRVWDSCQFDAFMREASGHNPLGTEALRTWRRIHHKLVADVERWGEPGCVACGRCDRACPTGIGIFAVVEEICRRYA